MAATNTETRGFQAEVRQLLRLMIHSLYSHREIFLRELISNASDANDKLRFLALSEPALLADGGNDLHVWVEQDAKAGTVTIRDNGIGLTRDEAIEHLGTIAKSGTAEFFSRLTGDQQKDSQLIGQFGVGFYSSFIVADRVDVYSRRAGQPADAGVHWSSSADGEFTVETVERAERGTSVVLHLKEDAREFADAWRLRSLVRRYSDHLAFPVLMQKEGATLDFEPVNQATALWTRPRTEIKDDEYKEFYRHITHDGTEPLAWSHNKVEGKREYTSLLYVPGRAPFDLWQRDAARGLKLHVRRVFIMDDAEQFLPLYLRFVKGVLDSSDLPLNVSRELLQQDPEVEAMRGALTRRALDMLVRLARDDAEKYASFWKEFGQVLKEGVAEDPGNRDKILPLLRFTSTHEQADEDRTSLANYVARMKEGQQRIYYVIAESRAAARTSPYIERLRARGIEVLLLADRVDEWIMGQVSEFDGKRFQDAARGDLDLAGIAGAEESAATDAAAKDKQALLKRVKDALGDAVIDVRVSARLADSPSCLVRDENDMGAQMRRIMAASGRDMPPGKPHLELNVGHPLIERLEALQDDAEFAELAAVLYDQAALAEEGQVANPGEYVRRLNRLLVRLAGGNAGGVTQGSRIVQP